MEEYEEYEEYEESGGTVNRILIALIAILLVAVGVVGFLLIRNMRTTRRPTPNRAVSPCATKTAPTARTANSLPATS